MSTLIPLVEIEAVAARPSPALVKSIREQGFLPGFPVILLQNGGLYRILDGRRRVAAARKAGLASVDAILREQGGAEITILAHATRSENPVAELAAIQQLVRAGLSEEQIARAGYATLQRIRRIARLNRLAPEIAGKVEAGEIAPGVAFQIAALAPEVQRELAQEEKITAAGVRESRSVQRQNALPGLEALLAPPLVRAATIEEAFAELSNETLFAILAELPDDKCFVIWRGKVQKVLHSRALPTQFQTQTEVNHV